MRISGNDLMVLKLLNHDNEKFYSAFWQERIQEIEETIVDKDLDLDTFLDIPALNKCGLETNDENAALIQLSELKANSIDIDFLTPTNITHKYHLFRAGFPRELTGAFVEWGGGYGNVARLNKTILTNEYKHYIVDSPIMSLLQMAYLDEMNAKDNVEFVGTKIDYCVQSNNIDTFFATFSIDECTKECHDYLFSINFYGARNVFIAMYPDKFQFPEAEGLYDRLLNAGFREEPSAFPPSVYMVRND